MIIYRNLNLDNERTSIVNQMRTNSDEGERPWLHIDRLELGEKLIHESPVLGGSKNVRISII